MHSLCHALRLGRILCSADLDTHGRGTLLRLGIAHEQHAQVIG
jgi:hypothetical protein